MRRNLVRSLFLSVSGIICFTIAAQSAPMYGIANLDNLPAGAGVPSVRTATGINNLGQVVGTAYTPVPYNGTDMPTVSPGSQFVFSGGQVSSPNLPTYGGNNVSINNNGTILVGDIINGGPRIIDQNGAPHTPQGFTDAFDRASGINDSGAIVGTAQIGPGYSQVFIQNGSTRTDIPNPTGAGLQAVAINNNGDVIATTPNPTGTPVASYIYTAGTLTALGTLGGNSTVATAINNQGQVVGWSNLPGNASGDAFVWSDGKLTDLGNLGNGSVALSINNKGEIVGTSSTGTAATDETHAFVYQNGVMKDLNSLIDSKLGYTLLSAVGVNDLGQIIGSAKDSDGKTFSYLLTPDGVTSPSTPVLSFTTQTPEPGTIVGFGVLGLVLVVRKYRIARSA